MYMWGTLCCSALRIRVGGRVSALRGLGIVYLAFMGVGNSCVASRDCVLPIWPMQDVVLQSPCRMRKRAHRVVDDGGRVLVVERCTGPCGRRGGRARGTRRAERRARGEGGAASGPLHSGGGPVRLKGWRGRKVEGGKPETFYLISQGPRRLRRPFLGRRGQAAARGGL